MKNIEERTDVTDWIIHFIRERDPQIDAPLYWTTCYDHFYDRLAMDTKALFILKYVIEMGALKPEFSLRKGKTTLYGGSPVVCFTEMPIYNFAKYVKARNDYKRCSPYGICLLKKELYAAGARPVIYGLSQDPSLLENSNLRRILPNTALPQAEQYRYVVYQPGGIPYDIDWTHEREWRWKAEVSNEAHQVVLPAEDGREITEPAFQPALPLFLKKSAGGYFSNLGIIVWNKDDAAAITQTLLLLRDAGYNRYGTPFDQDIISKVFIILLQDVLREVETNNNREANRIEDILQASEAIVKLSRFQEDPALRQKVRNAVENARQASVKAMIEYVELAPRSVDGFVHDVFGQAYVVTTKTDKAVVQALVELGLAKSVIDAYHIDAIGEVPIAEQQRLGDKWKKTGPILPFSEAGAQAAADVLNKTLGEDIFGIRVMWD